MKKYSKWVVGVGVKLLFSASGCDAGWQKPGNSQPGVTQSTQCSKNNLARQGVPDGLGLSLQGPLMGGLLNWGAPWWVSSLSSERLAFCHFVLIGVFPCSFPSFALILSRGIFSDPFWRERCLLSKMLADLEFCICRASRIRVLSPLSNLLFQKKHTKKRSATGHQRSVCVGRFRPRTEVKGLFYFLCHLSYFRQDGLQPLELCVFQ